MVTRSERKGKWPSRKVTLIQTENLMVLRPDFMLAFVKRYKGELIEVNGDELSDISFDESSETESKSSENYHK